MPSLSSQHFEKKAARPTVARASDLGGGGVELCSEWREETASAHYIGPLKQTMATLQRVLVAWHGIQPDAIWGADVYAAVRANSAKSGLC